jgi:hypothetical protein
VPNTPQTNACADLLYERLECFHAHTRCLVERQIPGAAWQFANEAWRLRTPSGAKCCAPYGASIQSLVATFVKAIGPFYSVLLGRIGSRGASGHLYFGDVWLPIV